MTETEFSRTGAVSAAEPEEEGAAARLRQQASDVASTGTQEAQHVASTAKEEASAVVSDAGTQARRVVNEATTQLRRQGDDQVNRLAGTLGDLSQELRRMSAAGGEGTAAGLAGDAADLFDRLGGRLIEGGLDGTMNEVKRFARNRPAVFLAAAAGAGFVAGRLVRNVDRSAFGGGQPSGDGSGQARQQDDLVTGPASSTGGLPGTKGAPPGTTGLVAGPSTAQSSTREPRTGEPRTGEPRTGEPRTGSVPPPELGTQ
jgi:hypothetical protein